MSIYSYSSDMGIMHARAHAAACRIYIILANSMHLEIQTDVWEGSPPPSLAHTSGHTWLIIPSIPDPSYTAWAQRGREGCGRGHEWRVMPCRRVWSYAVWEESGMEIHYDIRFQLFNTDDIMSSCSSLSCVELHGIGLCTHLHGVP